MSMIRLQNLHVTRQGSPILQDINLEIQANDRVAILGPNGAGKSFLLRILSADLVPSFGSYVEIFGQVFGKTRLADLRQQIGFVATRQAFWFDSKDTLWQVVASGLDGVYGASREFEDFEKTLIDESLAKFDLTKIQERPFEVLSDGEKRRTLLARSLVRKPKLLILDEPAIGLDIPTRLRFLETVDELSQELPLIYVTHNLEELPQSINKIVFLKAGQIFAQGSKEAMLTSENLSNLLDIPMEVVHRNGKYFTLH
jgi:iron complex transport system ATP-binding protein